MRTEVTETGLKVDMDKLSVIVSKYRKHLYQGFDDTKSDSV